MKQLIFLLSCLISPCIGLSQVEGDSYHPFIEDGKQWLTGSFPMGDPIYPPRDFCSFSFEGDTVVAGHSCKKWVKRTQHFFNSDGHITTDFILPLFEENQQIWFFFPNETEPRLLYDFQVKSGPISVYDPNSSSQHSSMNYVKTAINEGNENCPFRQHILRTADFVYDNQYGITRWIEGIGTFYRPDYNYITDLFGETSILLVCSVGEEKLYENSAWKYKTDIHDIQIRNSKSIHHSCYDLSGRRVSASSVLPRGVYIRDGKKFVVR